MHIYVISLPNAKERRQSISTQMEKFNIKFEFVDAIYGTYYIDDISRYNNLKAIQKEGRSLSAGEVGCALSHNYVYSLIAQSDIPYALILEDDAVLSPDLPFVLDEIEKNIEQGSVITLERCDVYKKHTVRAIYENYTLVVPRFIREGSIAQAAGYIVTHSAAQIMQKVNYPVYFPADSWGYYEKQVLFYAIVPSMTLIRQNTNFESSTQKLMRNEFTPNTSWKLWFYGFRTYNPLGRMFTRTVKKLIKR